MPETLAILGGTPLTDRQWPFYNTIGEEEKHEVMAVLDSGVLSDFIAAPGERFLGGPQVRRLEETWAAHFGVKHAVAMNSCTSCLHGALVALGVGPGDEVIVPQLGMCAAATVVLFVGATPVFADCDPVRMLISPASVVALITPRTKAVIAVHLAGHPAPMDELMELAEKHGLFVIEDNAQAPGAICNGRLVGTIGHVGCFSLNCHKIIQSGEGGVACTRDPAIALRLQLFRNHGEKCLADFGLEQSGLLGLNLRMTEMEAAVAYHQLARLPLLTEKTMQLAECLTRIMRLPGIEPPMPAAGCSHVYYIYHWNYDAATVGIPAALFAKAVAAEGVPVYAHYGYLISRLPPFCNAGMTGQDHRYPGACAAVENSLWTMLVRPHLDYGDIDLIVAAVRKVYGQRDQLQRSTLNG